MRKYKTVQGDRWDTISYKMYNNEFYINNLINANLMYRETVIFDGNITLDIPEILSNTSEVKPKWKQEE